MKKLSETVKYELKRHLSDATALTTWFMPIYAVIDTQVANMSNSISINSRLYHTAIGYAGLASLTKLRDFSNKKFGITEKTRGLYKVCHDTLFTLALIGTIKPGIYLLAGETDWKKIAVGTGVSLGLGGSIAGLTLYFVDVYRELTGIKESERTPVLLKRQSKGVKKTIAAALLAASLSLTGAYYYVTRNSPRNNPKPNIEQIVEAEK